MPPETTRTRGVLEGRLPAGDPEGDYVNVGGQKQEGRLGLREKLSYSVGHMLNDLTASVWFTYMLVYLQEVVNFGPVMAGNLILIGQVADAIFNPIIGFLSDRDCTSCIRLCDRRKRWHFLGSVCVALAFPLMLTSCFGCQPNTPTWALLILYITLIVIFQFGWASAQISHLSLITELSHLSKVKLELNAMRYGATVISNMVVYGVTWGLFGDQEQTNQIQEGDAVAFGTLGISVVGIGIFTCIIFYIGTPRLEGEGDVRMKGSNSRRPRVHISRWLKDPRFYILALLYMCARLIVNLTQVYIPFYVTETLDLQKQIIAVYPLVMYVFSFLTAVMVKVLARRCSAEVMYLWGALNVVGASVWMVFLQPHLVVATFGTAILSGIGGAAVMVTSLSMVSEYIGLEKDNSAFVFGAMGFCDKLCNGLAVFAIQNLSPCHTMTDSKVPTICTNYIRIAIGIIPGAAAICSIAILGLATKLKVDRPTAQSDSEYTLITDDTRST